MPFVDSIEQALLNHFFTSTYTPDTTMFLGLSTTTPNDAGGNVTEPVANGYARIALPTMGAASGTAPVAKSNTVAATFAAATGAWGTVTHMILCSAGTAAVADVLAWAALGTSKTVNSGDTASFAIGALVFQLGKGTPG